MQSILEVWGWNLCPSFLGSNCVHQAQPPPSLLAGMSFLHFYKINTQIYHTMILKWCYRRRWDISCVMWTLFCNLKNCSVFSFTKSCRSWLCTLQKAKKNNLCSILPTYIMTDAFSHFLCGYSFTQIYTWNCFKWTRDCVVKQASFSSELDRTNGCR